PVCEPSCREVRIGDDDGVRVTHGVQRGEERAGEKGVYSGEHGILHNEKSITRQPTNGDRGLSMSGCITSASRFTATSVMALPGARQLVHLACRRRRDLLLLVGRELRYQGGEDVMRRAVSTV